MPRAHVSLTDQTLVTRCHRAGHILKEDESGGERLCKSNCMEQESDSRVLFLPAILAAKGLARSTNDQQIYGASSEILSANGIGIDLKNVLLVEMHVGMVQAIGATCDRITIDGSDHAESTLYESCGDRARTTEQIDGSSLSGFLGAHPFVFYRTRGDVAEP